MLMSTPRLGSIVVQYVPLAGGLIGKILGTRAVGDEITHNWRDKS